MNAKRKRDHEDEPRNIRQRETHGPAISESENEDSSEEDVSWENLDLSECQPNSTEELSKVASSSSNDFLDIRLPAAKNRKKSSNPEMTAFARKLRFEIHKLHLLCLIYHASLRNSWASNPKVSESLKRAVRGFKGNVNPPVKASQYQRTRILLEGLKAAVEYWHELYTITSRGLHKAKWSPITPNSTLPVAETSLAGGLLTFANFCRAASSLKGDRDVGIQLFTSFLRLLGLETRLVCSLQPLAFRAGKTNVTMYSLQNSRVPSPERDLPISLPTKIIPANARKLTKPSFGAHPSSSRTTLPAKIQPTDNIDEDSPYPIYWTEVFDPAAQKWIPVDALVTRSVGKPSKFEPPMSDSENTLSYVLGFAADNSAKDITIRYTKQFNAKVRKLRVMSIPSGDTWWKRVMKFYKSPYHQDRHQIEQAEFLQLELKEGIPKNVSDLKNHPVFVIERHLHRNQIIHPMVPCGSIVTSRARPPVVGQVYARKHVHTLRSSLAWYIRGRQVRAGEHALKHVQKRGAVAESADEPPEQEPLFAEFQTDEYVAAPVQDGIVPKNAYGNVDVYHVKMIPPGGVHIPHSSAKRIAQFMGIDFAEAVTGFDYRNRQTVPVMKGVVIAREFEEGFNAVCEAFMLQEETEAKQKKCLATLKRWNRFIKGLMIRRRIQNEFREGTPDATFEEGVSEFVQRDDGEVEVEDTGGGFFA